MNLTNDQPQVRAASSLAGLSGLRHEYGNLSALSTIVGRSLETLAAVCQALQQTCWCLRFGRRPRLRGHANGPRATTMLTPVHAFPARLRVGARHVGLPDRGRRRRRRPRRVDLGPLQPQPRSSRERRHRRHSLRSLPPLARGRRAAGRAGGSRLPVLGRLAQDPARRNRSCEPAGRRLLQPARRCAARQRDQAGGDAVPLRSARNAGAARRLDGTRHRLPLQGLHRDRLRGAR